MNREGTLLVLHQDAEIVPGRVVLEVHRVRIVLMTLEAEPSLWASERVRCAQRAGDICSRHVRMWTPLFAASVPFTRVENACLLQGEVVLPSGADVRSAHDGPELG